MNKFLKNKATAGLILAAVLIASYPAGAKAQSAAEAIATKCGGGYLSSFIGGKIFGTIEGAITINAVPVKDSEQKATTESFKLQECVSAVLETVAKAALEAVKKRLLDSLVDQIIQWIQGGGDSKFVIDWEATLRDAANAGIGDVIGELAPQLCSPFRTQVLISLQNPVFSQRAACTLDQVVDNIEGFFENFEDGGWIAYYESWKPQNNYYGSIFSAYDEAVRRAGQRVAAAQQETQASGGFIDVKRCTFWEFKDLKTNASVTRVPGPSGLFYVVAPPTHTGPNKPPPPTGIPPELIQGKYDWRCTKTETVTPGRVVGELTTKAVGADIDYLVNAQDLTQYIAAIADAVINRLTREGLSLLQPRNEYSPGGGIDCSTLSGPAREQCYGGTGNQAQALEQTRTTLLNQVGSATSSLNTSLQTFNQSLVISYDITSTLQDLYTCAVGQNATSTAVAASSTLATLTTVTQPNILNAINQINAPSTGLISIGQDLASQIRAATTIDELTNPTFQQTVVSFSSSATALRTAANASLAQSQADLEQAEDDLETCQGP